MRPETVHLEWRKSSRSGANGGACVEVADLHDGIAVRDSKDPDGPKLIFPRNAFRLFAAELKLGGRPWAGRPRG